MKNIFSLMFVNDSPKKQPFIPKKARQKIVWYDVKNAIDPLTGECYGDCRYKILYVNDKYWASSLISLDNCLIGDKDTAKRFYSELVNYLDDQRFNSIFNLV